MSDNTRHHHICLLGDSIIDNGKYIPVRLPCVRQQLETRVKPLGWKVTQLAKDGAIMGGVRHLQLANVPWDATVIVLSVGGNDGLRAFAQLKKEPWKTLTTFFAAFRKEYEELVDDIRSSFSSCTLIVCTIYQVQLGQHLGWFRDTVASVGVRLMNRIIRDVASTRNVPVVDLWTIFSQRADFANCIEPGVPGGHKLVRNVMAVLNDKEIMPIYDDCSYDPEFERHLAEVTHFETNRFFSSAQ